MSQLNGVLVAALLSAATPFANSVTVMAADDPPAPKSAASADASSKSAGTPMIIHNPDGTFTIQKRPSNATAKDSKAGNGLMITPQVVVPFVRADGKKP